MSDFFAFTMSIIAGSSTIIGMLIIFKKNKENSITNSLAFSSGVILSISLFDLIPETIKLLNYNDKIINTIVALIFFNLGILVLVMLEKLLLKYKKNHLYKIGLIMIITMIIHNIPEGIVTFIAASTNMKLGLSLTIAIALHNIPEGISIAIPIYYSTKSKYKTFLAVLIAGCSEFVGTIIGFLFFKKNIDNNILGYMFAFIAGLMFYVSIYELFPKAYFKRKKSLFYFILGFIMIILSNFLI